MKLIQIHPLDNVAVALDDIHCGEALTLEGGADRDAIRFLTADQDIPRGHKIALTNISEGMILSSSSFDLLSLLHQNW